MRLSRSLVLGLALCLFSTVAFSSVASAAPWLGLFGSGASGQGSQDPAEESSSWWDVFKNKQEPATPPSNEPQPPTNEPKPTPPPPAADDQDKDGLSASREAEQKTSDSKADTDGDGLSDFTESKWYSKRDVVFCGPTCAYPDPMKKDVYVEVDWMVFPNKVSTQPAAHQVQLMIDAFAKEGINMHVDTGQYGGGNAVPYNAEIWFGATTGEIDFVDYKRGGDGIPAQFKTDRDMAWHYMIIGDHYKRATPEGVKNTSSGVGNVSGPNSFIAFGVMPDRGRDLDVPGTMMHELGHNLCLRGGTSTTSACTFPGIDSSEAAEPNSPYGAYRSSMNYRYQFEVGYSHNPTKSPHDHDDWGAIQLDVFSKYNEAANGQSQKVAHKKTENNRLENFNHAVEPRLNLGLNISL